MARKYGKLSRTSILLPFFSPCLAGGCFPFGFPFFPIPGLKRGWGEVGGRVCGEGLGKGVWGGVGEGCAGRGWGRVCGEGLGKGVWGGVGEGCEGRGWGRAWRSVGEGLERAWLASKPLFERSPLMYPRILAARPGITRLSSGISKPVVRGFTQG